MQYELLNIIYLSARNIYRYLINFNLYFEVVYLCKLIQVVFQKGNFLLLSKGSTFFFYFFSSCWFSHARLKVLVVKIIWPMKYTYFRVFFYYSLPKDYQAIDIHTCTKSFLKLCNVCNSLATVSSSPLRSCLACSLRSLSNCSSWNQIPIVWVHKEYVNSKILNVNLFLAW